MQPGIEALRPMANDGALDLRRGYQVLVLRFIEGLRPGAAGIRLGVGKSQLYANMGAPSLP